MARGKKKESLTIEEQLEAALVPEDEQPYEVPGNWCWVYAGSLFDYKNGFAFKSTDYVEESDVLNCRMSNIRPDGSFDCDYKKAFLPNSYYEKYQEYVVKDGDIILALTDMASENPKILGLPTIVHTNGQKMLLNQRVLKIIPHSEKTKLYLNRVLQFMCILKFRAKLSGGGSLQINLKTKDITELPIPFPTAKEQRRIVERIESLFSQLDEARDKAQEALDGFELRKDSLLHKAFIGELSIKWRKQNQVELETWRYLNLRNCSTTIGDGLHGTPIYSESGEYFFVNGNNFDGREILIKSDTKRVDKKEYDKYFISLSTNDTVFVSINGTLGKTAFYNDEPIILGKSACYVNTNENISKHFLRYYFESKEFRDYANDKATGSTIKNLGLKAMREMVIPVPSIKEQEEIVKILENTLSEESKLIDALDSIIDNIDILKKSILSKAFRGELGTNDPEDESAVELVKRVVSSR